MNERVVEILVYIMSEIHGTKQVTTKLDVLSRDLLQRGYTENEISSAFSWLFDRYRADFEELIRNTGPLLNNSFRILHDLERMIITPAAHGYLLQLRALGILDDGEIEQIIERAMMMGGSRIDENEIKALIASTLFNTSGTPEGSFLFFELSKTIH
jgi:uncharacterized protein Smg (DUF494 family)